jgi:hypothetical protein
MDVELKRIEGIAVLDLTARLSDEASENVDALLPRRARCAGFPAGICLKPSSKTALLAKRRAEFPGVWSSSSGVAGASPPAELAHASRGRNHVAGERSDAGLDWYVGLIDWGIP